MVVAILRLSWSPLGEEFHNYKDIGISEIIIEKLKSWIIKFMDFFLTMNNSLY